MVITMLQFRDLSDPVFVHSCTGKDIHNMGWIRIRLGDTPAVIAGTPAIFVLLLLRFRCLEDN